DGGGVLRLREPACDGRPQPRHLHALFARGIVCRGRRAHLHGSGRLGDGRGCGSGAFDRRHHVALGHAAILAGARNGRDVDAGFGGQLAHRRRERRHTRRLGPGLRTRRFFRGRRGRGSPPVRPTRRGGRGARGGGAVFSGAPAPSLIWPSSAPTATVSPSLAAMSPSTPAAGAGTSIVTLSVSSSTSGSSTATGSPGFLNHLPMVASVTDSPSVG